MVTEQVETDSLYQDAMKEYGMKGTLLPPAASRAQHKSEEGVAANVLGAHFDLHKPVAHNIVEILPDGSQKITRLDPGALARMQNANNTKHSREQGWRPIGYQEAVTNKKPQSNMQKAAAAPVFNGQTFTTPRMPAALQNENQERAVPSRPRTMVKFEGSFGRLSVPYDEIYQDPNRADLLIMVQRNADGNHFEAPETDDYILVNVGTQRYLCLSGVQFVSENRLAHYTVFVIDFAKMQEAGLGNQEE